MEDNNPELEVDPLGLSIHNEEEFLNFEKELANMLHSVERNAYNLEMHQKKGKRKFAKVEEEIKRCKTYFTRLKEKKERNEAIKKRKKNNKEASPRTATPSRRRKIKSKIAPSKLRTNPYHSPSIQKRMTGRKNTVTPQVHTLKKKKWSTQNSLHNRRKHISTPKLRNRNYAITPIVSKRHNISHDHHNTSLRKGTGSKSQKKKNPKAQAKPELPFFLSYEKMPKIGQFEQIKYSKLPKYSWSVRTVDFRKKKYYRSEIIIIENLRFVIKIITRGERGKRRISVFVEYVPSNEGDYEEDEEEVEIDFSENYDGERDEVSSSTRIRKNDVSLEISVILLNSIRGGNSIGFNSVNVFNRKNLSYGWPFFGLKKKIIRKSNGFVYDDQTICFEISIKDLVLGNRQLVGE